MNLEPTDTDIQLLRGAMVAVASEGTAYNNEYDPTISPLHNHCGAVAYVVQQKFGGSIMTKSKMYHGVTHRWNVLEDGRVIDLTSDQFGGDGFTLLYDELNAGFNHTPARKVAKSDKPNERFVLFAERVDELLANMTESAVQDLVEEKIGINPFSLWF